MCLTRSGAVLETHDVVTIDDDECLLASLRRKFSVDVAFKFSLGDDRLTEEVCNSEAYKYLEFKTLEKSFVCVGTSDGKTNGKKGEFEFVPVPASRAEIFENARLSPTEKRGLMRFLKKARDVALEGTGVNYGRGDDANAPIGAPGTEYTLDAEREDEGTFFANDGDNNSSSSSKKHIHESVLDGVAKRPFRDYIRCSRALREFLSERDNQIARKSVGDVDNVHSFNGKVRARNAASWFNSAVRIWRGCAGFLSRGCGERCNHSVASTD